MTENIHEAQLMYDSSVGTPYLAGRALSDRDARGFIAGSQRQAIERIVMTAQEEGWFEARKLACQALAAAGYTASDVISQARQPQ